MLVIHDSTPAVHIADHEIAGMVNQRIAMLSQDEPYNASVHGFFIVLEAGDGLGSLEPLLGFPVLENRFSGVRFGSLEFTPSFEFIEEHEGCYEMVFVLSDDGYGVELFIPKAGGTDADLLAMCRAYVVHSEEDPSHET